MAVRASYHCKSILVNKGVIVVLLWSLFGWIGINFGFSFLISSNSNFQSEEKHLKVFLYYGIVGIALLLCPVFGWIADVYWGRYKMIKRSLFTMWLTTIGFCLVSVIPDYLPHANTIKEVANAILLMIFLSLGGLQVNIIQFGVDQLTDASSNSITAFANWYVWVFYINVAISDFSQKCVCSKYIPLAKLLLPACMTLALCLDYNFNHWLIKEPVSENPLKLIYRVIRYAWKNKYPRQRSAFTYSEDKRYSRIDFAKQKFGGPFTTEKVEDVKTFWRMLLCFIILFIYSTFIMNVHSVSKKMKYHLQYTNIKEDVSPCSMEHTNHCYQGEVEYSMGYLAFIIFIPLHELAFHRLITVRFSSFTTFNIGFFLSLISMIGYFSLEIAGHIKLDANITNVTCLLEVKEDDPSTWNSLPLDHKWIILPVLVRTFSYFFILSGGMQFICAQSPYSMKGLITGLGYALFGLSIAMIYLVLLPITYTVHKWPPNRYGCGTWYLLAASIVFLLAFMIAVIISQRYKKRQRDDILPNEHIFAINYYSHYTMYNSIDSS